ncbi:MAG: cellulose binding domain-containing protein [Micromonosporaceae bacterium]|nr:cellulose binding domain-containing protein [Micromonosporaceae bacterium]
MSSRRNRLLALVLSAALLTIGAALVVTQQPAGALPDPPGPVTGNATWFTALGQPYGGCGLPQANLDSQNFVALNVYNTPNDYNFYPRPLPDGDPKIGMWNNGHNCGRWVQVTIGDNCTGVNDGAPGQPFCRNGSFVSDGYNGAVLNMIVADSCGDSNAWCRDDPFHLDLAQGSLNLFAHNGTPVGDMYPAHWNNRHISWQFIAAPNYSGDINIGFLQGAQVWWPALSVSHLANGIHGVEFFQNGAWQQAQMDGDMGEAFIIGGTTAGTNQFQIRVRDASDQLINNGRVYNFTLPAGCASQCSAPYTQTSYTTSAGTGGSPSVGTSSSPSRGPSVGPSSAGPSIRPSTSPSAGGTGASCSATYTTTSSWQGGYQAQVTVKNTGSSATTGWTVTVTNPSGQSIAQLWDGTLTNGNPATVRNAPYNGSLAPGATTTFGYLGNSSGTVSAPTLSCAPS